MEVQYMNHSQPAKSGPVAGHNEMITATILDTEMRPISEDFPVIADDFVPAILEAKRLATAGTRCCIMWQRSEDGQVAYYGPRGCSIQPHWYSAPGRPKEIEAGRRVNVWLDQASVERAEALGNGNVSSGIRAALSESLPSTEIESNRPTMGHQQGD